MTTTTLRVTTTTPSLTDDYVAALHWANGFRAALGLPQLVALPRGLRGISDECPLARATGLRVDGDSFYPRDDIRPEGELPSAVCRFALAFDQGAFPHLEDRP
jgi:hypothetical protein